jgi:hypothetical protein
MPYHVSIEEEAPVRSEKGKRVTVAIYPNGTSPDHEVMHLALIYELYATV